MSFNFPAEGRIYSTSVASFYVPAGVPQERDFDYSQKRIPFAEQRSEAKRNNFNLTVDTSARCYAPLTEQEVCKSGGCELPNSASTQYTDGLNSEDFLEHGWFYSVAETARGESEAGNSSYVHVSNYSIPGTPEMNCENEHAMGCEEENITSAFQDSNHRNRNEKPQGQHLEIPQSAYGQAESEVKLVACSEYPDIPEDQKAERKVWFTFPNADEPQDVPPRRGSFFSDASMRTTLTDYFIRCRGFSGTTATTAQTNLTNKFQSQLKLAAIEHHETLECALKLVHKNELPAHLESLFAVLLQESETACWQQNLAELPREIDEYVHFKLTQEFAFTPNKSITLRKHVEVNQFLGRNSMDDILESFQRNCVAVEFEQTRKYFGNRELGCIRSGDQETKVGSFEDFWNLLETHICSFEELDTEEILLWYNGLRIICDGVMMLPYSLALSHLTVMDGVMPPTLENHTREMIFLKPNETKASEKGATQIDLFFDQNVKTFSRRQFVKTVHKETNEIQHWSLLVTAIKRQVSPWELNFSMFQS